MEESWTTVIYAVAGFLTECIACIQSMLALLGRRFYRPQFDGFHESTWILHIHFWCIHGILHPKYSLCWHEKSSTLRPIPRSLILFPYAKSNLSFEEWKLRLFCVMWGMKIEIILCHVLWRKIENMPDYQRGRERESKCFYTNLSFRYKKQNKGKEDPHFRL